ncbi:MAG: P27 family phage terminase small subunit [Peptoniphilus sp.]|uniref:P27 family phage terminase small subunit n=1 Tax=Peptoniphilus sp. TaxID=1971214 RepID=UPI002A75C4DA|nr:P27 family phage terminase small subunit [Peptoniphilus sp.]MDY2986124.1 P27 family phage terminase small subunit [Peptoniphilus sp.]
MANSKTLVSYKRQIIKMMKQVETYNKAFDVTIDTFAKIVFDYNKLVDEFEKSGAEITVEHTNKNGSTNIIKNPLYQSIEKLRTDLITYARELGLTPAGLKKLNQKIEEKPKSALDDLLSKM